MAKKSSKRFLEKKKAVGNLEVNPADGCVYVNIDEKVYPADVVAKAAFGFLQKAYVIIDGNGRGQISVEMYPQNSGNGLESLGREFNNALIEARAAEAYNEEAEKPEMKRKLFGYLKVIDNLTVDTKNRTVTVSIDPKVHSLDVVHSASYIFMDRAYVIIDGDPAAKMNVLIRPKDKDANLEVLGRDFNNELLNYSVYKTQSEKHAGVKAAILQRSLLTNTEDSEQIGEGDNLSYTDDPLGILRPWQDTAPELAQEIEEAESFGRKKAKARKKTIKKSKKVKAKAKKELKAIKVISRR